MNPRARIHAISLLVLGLAFGCGAPEVGANASDTSPHRAAPASLTAAGGLDVSSPLLLDKSSVVAGDVLRGTITYQNTSVGPISIQHVTIGTRPPGGTNSGGPFLDLRPQLGPQTVLPGATLTLAASRTVATTDPPGTWYAFATYQDAAGAWHDGPNVYFARQPIVVTVAPSAASSVVGGTLNFQASVTGTGVAQSTGVAWSTLEVGGGTVTAGGVYTAPALAGTYHVVATSAADPSKTDTATVTVTDTGLVISSPLAVDKTTVAPGDTLRGTVTWRNTSSSPISIQFAVISGRRPGGTNVGGPYDDLLPKLTTLQTVQPGATLTLAASRAFTSVDALGPWYAYATYQDATGVWHDGPNVNFNLAQPIAVTVTPSAASTNLGGTISFQASVAGTVAGQSTAVTWSVQEPAGGTVSAAGVYAAPAAAGTFHVVATSVADPSRTDSSTVSVIPGDLAISAPLVLDKTAVVAGDILHGTVTWQNNTSGPIPVQFAVISGRRPGATNVGGPYDDLSPRLTSLQMVQPAATLALAAARTFTSLDALGTWYAYATYQDSTGAWHDGPNVTFAVLPPIAVTVTPSAASTTVGGTLNFQASVTGTLTGQSTAVTWSVQEPAGGTVSAAGVYTAPATVGTYHVVATSVADPTKTDSSTVSVIPNDLAISTPLLLDKTTVVAGDTLHGTVTWQNPTPSPISIRFAVISGRRPGGTNLGGPYDDLLPKLTTVQTIQPGATLTLAASRTFTSADALGAWYSYATYQDAGGAWHDGPNVTFNFAQPIAVAVTPSAPATVIGGTINFQASVTGTAAGQSAAVTWSVQELGGGTVTAAGVYTAPATAGTYHVVATSVADPSKTATATVSVSSGDLVISSPLLLDRTTVFTGDTLRGTVTWQNTTANPVSIQFAVISGRRPGGTNVGGPYDDLLPKLTTLQTVQPGVTLTLAASRTFSSADPTGSWYSYATYQDAGGAWHDGPNVTFTVKQTIAVTVTPSAPSIAIAGTIGFQASVTGTSAGQSTAVTWSVQELLGGTMSAAGVYTAPLVPGTYHVVATSAADPSKMDTATVTVTPPLSIAVSISPNPASIAPGGAMTFTATVANLPLLQSPDVTWSVLEIGGGTISPSGVYSAPTTLGTYHVVATSVADTSKSATAAVSVGTFNLIPAERLTAWNPGIAGGVPARTTLCATVSASTYGNGTADARAGIQAALDACPVGQVVQLSSGDFKIGGTIGITKGVVLRGQGPTLTKLKMPVGTSATPIVVGTRWFKFTQSRNLASNAVKGSQTAVLTANPGLTPGEIVVVDQVTNPAITEWSTKSPPGDVSRTWFTRPDRPVGQVMEVQSVSGTTVTFTTPFHIDFQTAYTAQLSRFSNVDNGPVIPSVKFAGVEDLYVYGGSNGQGNIQLENAAYSWIKNVESDFQDGESVGINASFRCIVRDSYIHSTQTPSPGGGGYGFSFSWYSADNLLENNISWNMNKVMVMRASGGGNVIGYNYMEDGWINSSTGWVETGINASHMTCPHYELFEGNQSFNFDGDNTWGNAVYITAFRNHLTGKRRSTAPLAFTDTGNRRAIGLMEGHKWYSFVGNVLGTANQPLTGYVLDALFPWGDNPVGMWRLGYNPENWGAPPDPNVTGTVIREGNFDYATKQVHWVVGPQTLPASLYLTSKPAFFGNNPWPWVDPTGTVKVATLPARARFDAMHP